MLAIPAATPYNSPLVSQEIVYSADLTAGSLKLREARVIAGLLLDGVTDERFKSAISQENVLQARTSATAVRLARLIRSRLEEFDSTLWLMVRDGDQLLATQALLASAVRHSPLLRDFLDQVLRDEYRRLHTHLAPGVWREFLDGCQARDPSIQGWAETTRRRLRSTVFQILAQAGYLSDTRQRKLQNVVIFPELAGYLASTPSILSCLQLP